MIYRERDDIVLLDRVQGGSYASSDHSGGCCTNIGYA